MDMPDKPREDAMDAEDIIVEIRKLIESELAENEPTSQADAQFLEDAVVKIQSFIDAEKSEEPASSEEELPAAPSHVVDTGILTGPINGLRNFLIRKQQDTNS